MANPLEKIQNLLQCELMALSCMSDISYHMLKQDANRYKHQCNGTRSLRVWSTVVFIVNFRKERTY